jgi:4-hydroxybenzoate polyprenyltransferase
LFGANAGRWVATLYAAAALLAALAAYLAHGGWFASLGVAAFSAHLSWQIARIDVNDPAVALRLFRSNRDAGLLLFGGFLLQALIDGA